jgi:hypothetical protein
MTSARAPVAGEIQAMREATARVLEQSRMQREAISQMLTTLESQHVLAGRTP